MLQYYFSLCHFWLIKCCFLIHSTTPYIHPRLDPRIELRFSNGFKKCLYPYGMSIMICQPPVKHAQLKIVFLFSQPKHNLATTCDFQQCGILTSVDSDELVQPSFKLRNSKCCLVSRIFKGLARLSSDCV